MDWGPGIGKSVVFGEGLKSPRHILKRLLPWQLLSLKAHLAALWHAKAELQSPATTAGVWTPHASGATPRSGMREALLVVSLSSV